MAAGTLKDEELLIADGSLLVVNPFLQPAAAITTRITSSSFMNTILRLEKQDAEGMIRESVSVPHMKVD